MDPELVELLQGELPYQSSVYVIYSVRERRIDVISCNVNSKYSITRDLIECEVSPGMRSHLNRYLCESTIHNGCDFSGYFNGVSPDPLLNLMCDNTTFRPILMNFDVPNQDANTVLIPYTRYHLTEEQKLRCLGQEPIIGVEERMYGPWKLESLALGEGRLSVSLPQKGSMYVFAKLDTWSCLSLCDNRDLPEYAGCDEFILSSKFTKNDIGRLRDNAVDLVRHTIEHPGGYEPVNPNIERIVKKSMVESWPVRTHDHLTIT